MLSLIHIFKPITGSEYDSTALQTDLAAAQKTISQRMQLEGLTGASAAVSGDVITVSIPKTATGNTAAVSYTHLDVYKRQVVSCPHAVSYFSIR